MLGETAYQAVDPHLDQALSGHRAKFENVIRNANGEERQVKVEYVPDIDQRGDCLGVFALVQWSFTDQWDADVQLDCAGVGHRPAWFYKPTISVH